MNRTPIWWVVVCAAAFVVIVLGTFIALAVEGSR